MKSSMDQIDDEIIDKSDLSADESTVEEENSVKNSIKTIKKNSRLRNTKSKDGQLMTWLMRKEEHVFHQIVHLKEWMFILLLACVAFIVYSPNIAVHSPQPWVYDDHVSVVRNPCVRGFDPQGQYIPWSCLIHVDYWGQPVHTNQSHKSYRPVTSFFHRIQMQLYGLERPQLWHLTSAMFHSITSILFYLTIRGILRDQVDQSHSVTLFACRIGSILFAVHPIHTESVSNITGLAEVLGGLLSLLAFHIAQVYEDRYSLMLIPAMAAAVGATFAKETGIAAFPLILVHVISKELLFVKGQSTSFWSALSKIRVACLVKLLFITIVTVAVIYGRLAINVHTPTFAPGMNPAAFHPDIMVRAATFLYYTVKHIALLLFPYVLCPDYQSTGIPILDRLTDPRLFWLILTLFVMIMALIYTLKCLFSVRARQHELCLCLAWLILPYLPASNMFFIVGFTVAERILFSPSIGMCMLVIWGYKRALSVFHKNSKDGILRVCRCALFWFSMISVITMSIRTLARDYDWNHSHHLWLRTYSVCSPTHGAVANAALSLKDMHRIPEATQLMRFAVELNRGDGNPQTMLNLAGLLREQGNLDEALSICHLPASRGDPGAMICMADIFFMKKNFNETFNIYQTLMNRPDLAGRELPIGKDKMLIDSLVSLRELALLSPTPDYNKVFGYAEFCRQTKNLPPDFYCAVTCEIGKTLSQVNSIAEMRKAFKDARRICPKSMQVCMVIAEHLKNIKLFQESIDTLRECQNSAVDGNPWLFPKRATEVQLESYLQQNTYREDMARHDLVPILMKESLLNKIRILAEDFVQHKFSVRAATDLMMLHVHLSELFPRFPPEQVSQMVLFRIWDAMRANERALVEVYSRLVGNGPQDLEMFLNDVRASLQFLSSVAPNL